MELHDQIGLLLREKGPQIWHLPPTAIVYDAIALMAEKRIGALLVMAEGRLIGIVSERDYAWKVILQGKSSQDTQIQEIMTTPVVSVTSKNTVGDCMAIMTNSHILHLPVVDGKTVVGMLSIGDIVKWVISAQEETINQLSSYITGRYPG